MGAVLNLSHMAEWKIPMDINSSLKPSTKERIMDIVEAVGIDVSEWKASGAANPKFCYRWGFASEDRQLILLCLWYDDCEIDVDGVLQQWNFRDYIRTLESNGGPKAGRAREVDELLQDAWRLKVPIRVAIVDEAERKKMAKQKGEPSKPDFRELDSAPWHLTRYDMMTGECIMRRAPSTSGMDSAIDEPQENTLTAIIESDSSELMEDLLIEAARTDISSTTRDALVQARIGQGTFRAELIRQWQGQCAVTGFSELAVLRASHVMPWRSSNDAERLDSANGLLLTANLDALFDRGLISFSDDGDMLIAVELEGSSYSDLGIPAPLRKALSEKQQRYMGFHRKERFRNS